MLWFRRVQTFKNFQFILIAMQQLRAKRLKEQRLNSALRYANQNPSKPDLQIAQKYGVAVRTFSDRRKGRTQARKVAHEHEQVLSPREEKALVRWCTFMDDRGFPARRELVCQKAQAMVHASNPNRTLGPTWF
jgi:Tc5 transposase DNA-binding domain